ncbi:hypothetical protein FFLO_05029 [Filobasidium floriforme]|uniref:Xylanolytic transcriptional activator regulatory domain-containing protein n=1 Tax=Filobasidium floriforme TaxID=5210 RepID=A0A8K0NNL9_9TREE|nr:uncharacterized protein HD553DRAFT_326755 [Filobasidium floriforme]KAG7530430.1 hypothetical protein FFLO_05029 [Filobasidium floriforme]KAH8078557.1 hypothetical protein HD553DRAFT_326755 [Filobasidium floriforme]
MNDLGIDDMDLSTFDSVCLAYAAILKAAVGRVASVCFLRRFWERRFRHIRTERVPSCFGSLSLVVKDSSSSYILKPKYIQGSTAIDRKTGLLRVCALILLAVSMRLLADINVTGQRERHQLAWDIIGLAMRCALSAGLNHNHDDVHNDKRTWTTRIWTTLFALDMTISFKLGHQVGSRVGPSNLSHQSAFHESAMETAKIREEIFRTTLPLPQDYEAHLEAWTSAAHIRLTT